MSLMSLEKNNQGSVRKKTDLEDGRKATKFFYSPKSGFSKFELNHTKMTPE